MANCILIYKTCRPKLFSSGIVREKRLFSEACPKDPRTSLEENALKAFLADD